VETLRNDQKRMLTFFDFPAKHSRHLRTINPIESTFATVETRTKKTKGTGSRKAGLAMACRLLMAAQQRWRRVNAPHFVALVKAGVAFPDGEVEMLQCTLESEELPMLISGILAAGVVPIHST
jgi:transposase-like protein